MSLYVVEGGNPLRGEIDISGSKNATLPIIAASILNSGISVINNVPNIRDVKMMCSILENLGCIVERTKNTLVINSTNLKNYEMPQDLMREMRSSVIIVGALISRMKKCTFTYPRRL